MDNDIKVSVYCLAYNHEKYIRQTLEGFVNQKTNFKFEVLVHDDASTDNTAKIIKEYEEKYPDIIKPIYQTENQRLKKIPIFMKNLLPKMKGKYIASCEGDDYWCDNFKLQKQYDILEANPECSMSTHLVACCNEDGSANPTIYPDNKYNISYTGIITSEKFCQLLWLDNAYPFHTSSYFVRRDAFMKNSSLNWTSTPRDKDTLRVSFLSGTVYYFNEAMSTRRLNSIGNWNSRLKAEGAEGRFNLTMKDIKADIKFDEYTKYKYHAFIRTSILIRAVNWSHLHPETIKEFLKENNLTYKEIKNMLSLKKKIKYGIKYYYLMCSPFIK